MGVPPKSDVPLINPKELSEENCGINGRLTAITQLVHYEMLFVPIEYTLGGGMFEMNEVKGGNPYGAETYACGDGLRQPTKLELEQAFHQGKYIATITKKFKKD
ncbi:hypothetical protein Ahy_A05g022122 [Arachis hypogaea]|uniref:Uncharacterized protein n=1 Tax=Arachis hypogaea TaxID=3818 RepID=A0A445CZK9_ARAHY|nr:hypothetical protein Ahy_A05g022122 [Arachis hypogaea]